MPSVAPETPNHLPDPVEVIEAAYDETRAFYGTVKEELADAALGFRILYGPPVVGAPFLFLGYQPGGNEIEDIQHHESWPEESDYVVKPWPLARQIRAVFGPGATARSTGLNAIFFRAPSVKSWMTLPTSLRLRLERFSIERSEAIVRALKPKRIVVIGTGNFDLLTKGEVVLRSSKGVSLAKSGELWGVPATGTVHLSGYRLATADRELLRQHFSDAG